MLWNRPYDYVDCLDSLLQYIDGVTKIPEPIDSKKLKERRQLEDKQRQLEREIRKYKRYVAGTQDPETAKAYRKKLKEKQHELKVFIDENSSVLRRDYSREKVYQHEVDKAENNGIIELETPNGIKVKKFSKHMEQRAAERNVSVEDIKDALTNPLYTGEIKIDSLGRPSQRFIGERATVNVNPEPGTIPTIWKTGKAKRKKYKRE